MKRVLSVITILSIYFLAYSSAQVYYSYSDEQCTEMIGAYKLGNVGTCMPQGCSLLSTGLWTKYVCGSLDLASLPEKFAAYRSSVAQSCDVYPVYGAAPLNTCFYVNSGTAELTACGSDGVSISFYSDSTDCSGTPSTVNVPYNCSSYSGGYGLTEQCPPVPPAADVPLTPPTAAPTDSSTPSDTPITENTPQTVPSTSTSTPKTSSNVPARTSVAVRVLNPLAIAVIAIIVFMA